MPISTLRLKAGISFFLTCFLLQTIAAQTHSIGAEIFTSSPPVAYLIDNQMQNVGTELPDLIDIIKQYAADNNMSFQSLGSDKFSLKSKKHELNGIEISRWKLSLYVGEVFGSTSMAGIDAKLRELGGWTSGPKENQYMHHDALISIIFAPNPYSSTKDDRFEVTLSCFDKHYKLVNNNLTYDFTNVIERPTYFRKNALIVNHCKPKVVALDGNLFYYGTLKDGVPHDLSGSALLIYSRKEKSAFLNLARAIGEESFCVNGDVMQFTTDETKYGIFKIEQGKFDNGQLTGTFQTIFNRKGAVIAQNSTRATTTATTAVTAKKVTKKRSFSSEAELGNYCFKPGSVENALYNKAMVNSLSIIDFIESKEYFYNLLPYDNVTEMYPEKKYTRLSKKKQIKSLFGRTAPGGIGIKLTTVNSDESNFYFKDVEQDYSQRESNFYLYRGTSEELTFMGASTCSGIIDALEATDIAYYPLKNGQHLMLDVFDFHMLLEFQNNQLEMVHVSHNRNVKKLALEEGKRTKEENGDEPFCVDNTFIQKKEALTRAVEKLPALPQNKNVVNVSGGVCLSGCDNANGIQMIHLGNAIYYGPVKNNIPHDEKGESKFKFLEASNLENKEALPYYYLYETRPTASYVVVNGKGYPNCKNYNPSNNQAVYISHLNILNKQVYSKVELSANAITPVAGEEGLFTTTSFKLNKRVYYGSLNAAMQPHGLGLLKYKVEGNNDSTKIRGYFEDGKITLKELKIGYFRHEYANMTDIKIESNGKVVLSGDQINVTVYQNGEPSYLGVGPWTGVKEPVGTHKIYQKADDSTWKDIGNAVFDEFSGLLVSGPNVYSMPDVRIYYGISDQSVKVIVKKSKYFEEQTATGYMPFVRDYKLRMEQVVGTKRYERTRDFQSMPDDGHGNLLWDMRLKQTEFVKKSQSAHMLIGNVSKNKEVVVLVYTQTPNERNNTVTIEIFREFTIPPDRYAKMTIAGGNILGTRCNTPNAQITMMTLPVFPGE